MILDQYPLFTVNSVKKVKKGWRARGRLSSLENIGEGWVAYLYYPPRTIIEGRITTLDQKRKEATFVTEEQTAGNLLQKERIYQYLDGYWGYRVAIVVGPSREWRKIRFAPQNAVASRLKGGGKLLGKAKDYPSSLPDNSLFEIDQSVEAEVIQDGWDHEHCEICWEKIAEYAEPYGYKDEHDHWICLRCYKRYVEPGRIDFFDD